MSKYPHIPAIPALGQQRQDCHKFTACLIYIAQMSGQLGLYNENLSQQRSLRREGRKWERGSHLQFKLE